MGANVKTSLPMRLLILIASFLTAGASLSILAQTNDVPMEIVVIGKQPGPPLWRVKNGDNTLYIFARLSPIPKNITWESQRVAQVIAEADEFISQPDVDVSVSPLVMFNPINIFRGMSLSKRVMRNDNDAALKDVLPPKLYARFSALKAHYFPKNRKIENYRPIVAGGQMMSEVQNAADLVPANDVDKQIKRLVKRNRSISTTEIRYDMKIGGGFKVIARRVEELMDSIPHELELSCFERMVTRMEENIEEMQYRASAWAQGYIQEFKYIPLRGDADDDCTNMMMVSSEQETITEIKVIVSNQWLDAAEKALIKNRTTFAVLNVNELLLDNGLLAQLASRGYEVIEP
jgi:hypothetical protein